MDLLLLKTLHIAAALGVFTGIGAIVTAADTKNRKLASALHGISLLLLVLIGFAMLKKPPMDQHWWQVKLVLWIFLGVSPVLVKRKILPVPAVLGLCFAAGIGAAYLGLAKPF